MQLIPIHVTAIGANVADRAIGNGITAATREVTRSEIGSTTMNGGNPRGRKHSKNMRKTVVTLRVKSKISSEFSENQKGGQNDRLFYS